MSDEGTETLTIHLEDDASNAADAMTASLLRLASAQDTQAKAGTRTSESQAAALNRLREAGARAGGALAAALSGVTSRAGLSEVALKNLVAQASGFAMPQLVGEATKMRLLQTRVSPLCGDETTELCRTAPPPGVKTSSLVVSRIALRSNSAGEILGEVG